MGASLIMTSRQLGEMHQARKLLVEIVQEFLGRVREHHGVLQVTRIWSSKLEEESIARALTEQLGRPYKTSGIHTVWPPRAIDIAKPAWMREEKAEELAASINEVWAYDPLRPTKPVILYHFNHWHCQVHPHTVRRKENGEEAEHD